MGLSAFQSIGLSRGGADNILDGEVLEHYAHCM